MVVDPPTKGKTLRNVLNIVLHNGEWVVEHEIKKLSHKAPSTVALVVQVWLNPSAQIPDRTAWLIPLAKAHDRPEPCS
eukprot:12892228-Prorocentrum_lima.AAC.1